MGVEVIRLDGTIAGGVVSVDSKAVRGWLEHIDLEISAADGGSTTTVSLQSSDSGNVVNLLVQAGNTDARKYPRTLTHLDTDGTDLAAHTRHFVNGKVRFAMASAGASGAVACVFSILTDD